LMSPKPSAATALRALMRGSAKPARGGNPRLSLASARQRARAWDFNGSRRLAANAKLVHENTAGKLTAYFDYSDKTELERGRDQLFGDADLQCLIPAPISIPTTARSPL
jgi:hypothetical protein